MNAHKFIDKFGPEKAKRIIDNVVYDAEYYSDKTGSYYSNPKEGSIKISDLKRALKEYETLASLQQSYLTRLEHWNIAVMKAESKEG
ncbi:hypothetical protein KWE42_11230 [Acinetobacter pittii]|uniref:Uncharacterized protein n=1 Tax=Acinetobacter pittii TaxID=48296 RepID=A0AAE9SA52_ACIPI|nr:hypothetical protein [Acinetobacter pittii]AZP28712.1 hypothetical protein DLK06_06295 [Acinetobacter pittii]MBK0410137.1 hypothetical protein [Acinetobacter pittii]MBK1415158.1 hypothetical protein [Acinetobacter pittii]USU95935.1 hypothetical protein MWH18_06670 [Acinetobacter pittii]WGO90006.1 hypothetical protein QFB56_06550 [Acinetobacter pittii]